MDFQLGLAWTAYFIKQQLQNSAWLSLRLGKSNRQCYMEIGYAFISDLNRLEYVSLFQYVADSCWSHFRTNNYEYANPLGRFSQGVGYDLS